MFVKKLLAVSLVTSALLASAGAYADVITLNPQAPNTGASCPTAPCTIDPNIAAFQTDNLHGNLTSVLQINGLFSAPGPTPATWTESGTITLSEALLNNLAQNSGFGRASALMGGQYDIYLTFLSSGSGIWATSNNFLATNVATLDVQVWASPTSGTSFTNGTPSNSTDPTGGATPGNNDFLIATASVIADPTNSGTASIGNGSSGTAQTSLAALLDFEPVAGTTGPSGFFELPNPFLVNFGSSSSTNVFESTFLTTGSGATGNVVITTSVATAGTSNITPEFRAVPEPGMLSLVGVSLLALGIGLGRGGVKRG